MTRPLSRNSDPTPFDLNFRLPGVSVRVHASFWVFPLATGWQAAWGDESWAISPAWVAAVLVSILIRKLAAAELARRHGGRPELVLYLFGGYLRLHGEIFDTRARITTCLAGAGASAVLYLLAAAAERLLQRDAPATPFGGAQLLYDVQLINLWWGTLNLLPVFPLDAGRLCRNLLAAQSDVRGQRSLLTGSLCLASLLSCVCLLTGDELMVAGLFFLLVAVENATALCGGDGFCGSGPPDAQFGRIV